MHYVVATYRLKPEALDQAKGAILEYVEKIRKTEPDTFTYQCFQSDADSTRFVHLMAFSDNEAELKHSNSSFLKKFSERLLPFCIDGPHYETLRPVSSPAWFWQTR